jgi:hypothetical protein
MPKSRSRATKDGQEQARAHTVARHALRTKITEQALDIKRAQGLNDRLVELNLQLKADLAMSEEKRAELKKEYEALQIAADAQNRAQNDRLASLGSTYGSSLDALRAERDRPLLSIAWARIRGEA